MENKKGSGGGGTGEIGADFVQPSAFKQNCYLSEHNFILITKTRFAYIPLHIKLAKVKLY